MAHCENCCPKVLWESEMFERGFKKVTLTVWNCWTSFHFYHSIAPIMKDDDFGDDDDDYADIEAGDDEGRRK